jgi:hypothetical protein
MARRLLAGLAAPSSAYSDDEDVIIALEQSNRESAYKI